MYYFKIYLLLTAANVLVLFRLTKFSFTENPHVCSRIRSFYRYLSVNLSENYIKSPQDGDDVS